MTVAELSHFVIGFLGTYFFLLSAFCLLGLVRAFDMKTDFPVRLIFAGLLLFSLVFTQSFETICVKIKNEGMTPWIIDRTQEIPVWFVLAVLMVLTVCLAAVWTVMERQIRFALTPASLQEGLDFMPDGISFSTQDGIPLLVNRKMQNISYAAFGTGVLDMRRLLQLLEAGETAVGCHVEYKENAVFLHLQDGSIWDIQYREIPIRSSQVQECIAYDITEQHQKNQEMEKRNAHLAAVNKKMREYNQNLDSITREREILAAKVRIHDDVGRSLLALRAYLSHKNGDRKGLVDLWRFTVSALKGESVSRDTADRMEVLAQAAEAVDVKLVFDGEIPKEQQLEEVVAAAIHECLTNTVKHADGSELAVHTMVENNTVMFELKNNGKPPEGTVEEKSGLRTLRTIVEQHGGRMEILSRPEFLLRIQLRTGG